MKECAFCDYKGKLSKEHIAAKWLRNLFSGPIRQWHKDSNSPEGFIANTVQFQAAVVCSACNNGWMQELEKQYAQTVLPSLIKEDLHLVIGAEDAKLIAIFAFKTAVILDMASRQPSPFFSRRIRHAFRTSQAIPNCVRMWMCKAVGNEAGARFKTVYHQSKVTGGDDFLMYTCTGALGNFVFQVLAVRQLGNLSFRSLSPFPIDLAVPFWPDGLPKTFVWPGRYSLSSTEGFHAYAWRWEHVDVYGE
jgi:hypothetical protein